MSRRTQRRLARAPNRATRRSYVGLDDRNRDLEIIAVELGRDPEDAILFVIHVMPTQLRGGNRRA